MEKFKAELVKVHNDKLKSDNLKVIEDVSLIFVSFFLLTPTKKVSILIALFTQEKKNMKRKRVTKSNTQKKLDKRTKK